MVKERELNRVTILLVVLLFISLLLLITFKEFRFVGFLASSMALISLVIYKVRAYQDNVLGARFDNLGKVSVWALGLTFGFYILNKAIPTFQLAFPNLSLDITGDIRFFSVAILLPLLEAIFFRSVIYGIIVDEFKLSRGKEWKANLAVAVLFAFSHLLAYGVVLGVYDNWAELYGAVNAILGSLTAAGLLSFIWGFGVRRFGSLTFEFISHSLINLILFTASIVIF